MQVIHLVCDTGHFLEQTPDSGAGDLVLTEESPRVGKGGNSNNNVK